jgi:hypothetical protein
MRRYKRTKPEIQDDLEEDIFEQDYSREPEFEVRHSMCFCDECLRSAIFGGPEVNHSKVVSVKIRIET